MSNDKKYPFQVSKELWDNWRKRIENSTGKDPIVGFVLWEFSSKAFKLECWNVLEVGPVIFQFWPDGSGFQEYAPTNIDNLIS